MLPFHCLYEWGGFPEETSIVILNNNARISGGNWQKPNQLLQGTNPIVMWGNSRESSGKLVKNKNDVRHE